MFPMSGLVLIELKINFGWAEEKLVQMLETVEYESQVGAVPTDPFIQSV